MKKYLAAAAALVMILLLGWFAWTKQNTAKAPESASTAQVVAVKRGPLKQIVQCTGRVVSNRDVDIKCKASGLVIKMPVDISDPVKMGDLLVEIDPIDQERNVQQASAALAASNAQKQKAVAALAVAEANLIANRASAQAAVRSAEARAKDAQTKSKRETELFERKQASLEEAETAQTTAIQAQQELQNAQAQMESVHAQELELEIRRQEILLAQAQVDGDAIALALAKQRLTETKVMAPMDGVVVARTVQEGQIIASGINNVGGGTTVLTLSDLSRIFILASVDESDIGTVREDQNVEITADAFPRKKFTGKVIRIAARGVNVSNVITFEARIEVLSDNKSLLKPEMTANLNIITAEKADALIVPSHAIIRKADGSYVQIQTPDGAKEQGPVEVGLITATETEIIRGINENEKVIVLSGEGPTRWRADGPNPHRPSGMMMGPGMRRPR